MKRDKSCGVVVYRLVDGLIEYMLIEGKKHGEWGFAKGHVEGREAEVETAIREVSEESGLQVDLLDGFRVAIQYPLSNGQMKDAVYFLGKAVAEHVVIQESEIMNYGWFSLERAEEMIKYENTKAVLKAANDFLLKPYL